MRASRRLRPRGPGRAAAAILAGLAMGALGCAAVPARAADTYPTRVITLVVPFPAGAGTDAVARVIAPELARALNGSIVIENRASANSVVGAAFVARSAPDGYTLLMTTNTSHSAAPSLQKTISYDPIRDFTAIARGGNLPFMLVVNPKFPGRTVGELVAYAKANPGKLSYGASNSTGLVAGETFRRAVGIDVLRVPYKSTPAAMTDILGGHIDYMFVDLAAGSSMVAAGDLRALAVTTAERSAILPDLPSMREAGVPGLDLTSWNGLFGPAGMPEDLVAKINAATRKVLAEPALKQRLAGMGFDAFSSSPQELDAFVRAQLVTWARLIKEAGIQAE